MKQTVLFIVLYAVILTAACSKIPNPHNIEDDSIIIKSGNNHLAFVDLIKYNGLYLCAFREGNCHVPESVDDKNGIIRIYASKNKSDWFLAYTLFLDDYDLRDPCFTTSPNGNDLFIYCGVHKYNGDITTKSHLFIMSIDKDGNLYKKSSTFIDAGEYNKYWLWKVSKNGDKYYSMAYFHNKIVLLSSYDGIHFEYVSSPKVEGNEASIAFINNDIYAFIRSDKNIYTLFLKSTYPYTKWIYDEVPIINLQSPESIVYDDKIFISGRVDGKVSIYEYDPKSNITTHKNDLYSYLECGYPGIIKSKNSLYIAYYTTSHINSEMLIIFSKID